MSEDRMAAFEQAAQEAHHAPLPDDLVTNMRVQSYLTAWMKKHAAVDDDTEWSSVAELMIEALQETMEY